jgi:hypothetical protein
MATQSPSWTRPVALAGVLTVLSTGVYWLEFKKKPDTEKQKAQEKKVFLLDENQVAEVTLIQGASLIRLGCLDLAAKQCLAGTNSKWELRSPSKLRADEVNVHSLLSSLNNLLPTDSIDLAAEPAEKRATLLGEYGLSDDQRKSAQRVEITDESGSRVALVLGDVHPLGDSRFALVERMKTGESPAPDARVLMIPTSFKETISKPLTHWRDKKILTLHSGEISSIRYKSAKSSFEASKKDLQWTLSGRENGATFSALPGDIENIDNWSSAIAYLSAREFAAEQKTSPEARRVLSGARPVLEISLAKQGEKPITLQLLQKKSSEMEKLLLTASNLDPVYELEGTARQRLEKSIQDLRLSRLLGSMDRFNAREVTFRSASLGGSPVVFTKKDGKWARDGASTQDDDSKVTSILDRLSGNKVKAFLPERKPGKEALEVSLKNDKAQVLRKLEFWKEGGKVLGRDTLSNRREILELDPALESALPWDKL